MPASRLVSVWLPVIAWAAVIFALSSIPSLSSGLGTADLVLRKIAHVGEYAVLGALLVRALGREAPALLVGVAYASTDEVHQHFVAGRHASPVDVVVDTAGLALGIAFFQLVRRRLARRRAAAPAPAGQDAGRPSGAPASGAAGGSTPSV